MSTSRVHTVPSGPLPGPAEGDVARKSAARQRCSVLPDIHRGLAVVVDTTAIPTVIQETNSLTCRGYPVQALAARRSFEEIAYLLWYGELPDAAQLAEFRARERALRPLDRTTGELLTRLPETCHPMDVLRTAVSFFRAEDPTEDDDSPAANRTKSLDCPDWGDCAPVCRWVPPWRASSRTG